jgi:hypothetical protein
MRKMIVVIALVLSACADRGFGYWPKAEGAPGPQYWADVRECQTEMISPHTGPRGNAYIDACLTQRGYHLIKTE